jgi:hypothetical protein
VLLAAVALVGTFADAQRADQTLDGAERLPAVTAPR